MSEPENPVTAAVLIIGNEILSGRTQDSNLAYLARRLTDLGIRVAEAHVVPDEEETIVARVNDLRARHTYVFATGGIGPTHDDITAPSVAKAFGVPWVEHPDARAVLEARYTPDQLTPARLRMATMPAGASLIENPVSKVPGFRMENVFVLAGIPSIMQSMFESLAHELVGGPPLLTVTVVAELPEGDLAEPLRELQERFPDVQVGSYPFYGRLRFGASLVLRATDRKRLEAAREELRRLVRELGAEPLDEEQVR